MTTLSISVPEGRAQPDILAKQKNLLARFLDEVWNAGNEDAVDRYLAPEYTIFHDPGDPWHGQTLSRKGFKDRLCVSRAPFPDQRFTVQEMIAEPGKVAVSWTWTATHQGDIPGFPATGRPIAMSGLTIYSFKGEKLAGHWQMCDRLGVFQQLSGARL